MKESQSGLAPDREASEQQSRTGDAPPLLEKKYLKTIYNCHLCAGTLDGGDIDGDP
jgi:hypothetical protein